MGKQFNNRVYGTVVIIWLTLSVASVVLAAVTWMQLSAKLLETREAVAIRSKTEHILRLMVDCETGMRGYVLTGDENFLEPFQLGESNLVAEVTALVEMTRSDPALLNRGIELRAQIEVALGRLHHIVDMRKTKGFSVAAGIVGDGKGKAMMDKIRSLAAEISAQRSDVVSENGGPARAQLMRASLTSLVAASIGIGAGVFAFWLARIMLGQQTREKALMEAKLQAERSSQEKTIFLANMSHEIRTPMNAILGFSELLDKDVREPKQRLYLKSIRTSAGSLLQLINDILDMSKIEAGVMELRLQPTDPREICDFLHTVFAEPAAKKGVKLECQLAEDLPRALLMDRIRLRQVLVNLVGNAVKFTDHGNIYVRIEYEKQDTSSHINLLIEVQDTGVGIPPDKLEAIFKPFVQAGVHRERERAGTGLGLSIVRRLTEMMGGEEIAASVMGQGSAFSLRLPNISISAQLPVNEKLEPGREVNFNELRPATLLVVDDHETNCQLVAGLFADSHHQLHFGSNGAEAVSKARELRPDLILLDIRMPGLDGHGALAEIRKIDGLQVTPVIAVTASNSLLDPAMKTQFSGYVRKPFSRRELFDELARFLPRHGTAQPAPPATPGFAETPVARDLVPELKRLQSKEWPALRDSLAINETKAFAARLEKLGHRWNCESLVAYAQALAHHAETYAVVDMEKQLGEFGALVERLERSPAP